MPDPVPPFPEPTAAQPDLREVLLGYLDFFRQQVLRKVGSLTEADQRRSGVDSGWTPVELVRHLTFVELRWLDWGFEGRAVDDPWGDERDGRWSVGATTTWPDVASELVGRGTISAAIVRRHDLGVVGRDGPRWGGEPPATLHRVLLHLVQEYARHLGQLDVVVEQFGGATGE